MALLAGTASAASPTFGGPTATSVSGISAILKGTVNPEGAETTWRFFWGTGDCSVKPNACKPTGKGKIPAGTTPVAVEKELIGLIPGTVYHFLLEAESAGGKRTSTDRAFATQGTPAAGLSDGRLYEQSSPLDKDGGDALGARGLYKAAADGRGVTFSSSFGVPGGKGAQEFPLYLSLRDEGGTGWSTQGLLPPPVFGERAVVQGWTPDFSKTYSNVQKLGNPRTKALIEQSTAGGPTTVIAPYTPRAQYSYVGANGDDSIVFFESEARLLTRETGGTLITAAIPGRPNLYAWSRATGEVSLAGILNSGSAPAKGTLGGSYGFSEGINGGTLTSGGSSAGYYLQGAHAISTSGNAYFTEVGTGQIYERVNPTEPQSTMEGEKCLEADKACTIHVSASRRTAPGPDPAGPQPAAFQAASADGSVAYFTSPEKLTNESNTGPELPEAAIGTGSSATKTIENEALVKTHAIGVAVAGSHLYWADPTKGAIGRSGLDGSNHDDGFIGIPPGECEVEVEIGFEEFEVQKVQIPSTPRYVAVDEAGKYVYWTNTGRLDEEGVPIDGGGTIGRAELDGAGNLVTTSVEPAFICGEVEPSPNVREAAVSNPQGIAVNAGHIYWANAAKKNADRSIARAAIGGSGVEAKFVAPPTFSPDKIPYGVALDGGHVYFALDHIDSDYIERVTLEGTEPLEFHGFGVGSEGIRGLALDGTHLYWASQSERAIWRVPLADVGLGNCVVAGTCEFMLEPKGALNGLALDGTNLYWSLNGEASLNPGNDLYRFTAADRALEDLTVAATTNGAEVQGVLGASRDGSHIYFAANADLDGVGPGKAGDCKTPQPHASIALTAGSCEVYLWREGTISAVGRVRGEDASDWTGTPLRVITSFTPKSAFVSGDGETILFRSSERLSAYENEGVPELYRFRVGDPSLRCVSCPPTGEAVGGGPTLISLEFPGNFLRPLRSSVAMLASRNLAAEGNRAFFETPEALAPADTNGQGGCPRVGVSLIPACQDVYEWEAPGTGSCTTAAAGYSPLNEGCLYLVSSGKSPYPSYFSDASESGNDAFFFTRQGLVAQDRDELQDVYDAKAGGGIAAQNRIPPLPCEGIEACQGPYPLPPLEATPGTATFVGPQNPKPKPKKHTKKRKAKKHKQKQKSKAKAERRALR